MKPTNLDTQARQQLRRARRRFHLPGLEQVEDRVLLANFIVKNTLDSGPTAFARRSRR